MPAHPLIREAVSDKGGDVKYPRKCRQRQTDRSDATCPRIDTGRAFG